jgi:Lipase (class 3)
VNRPDVSEPAMRPVGARRDTAPMVPLPAITRRLRRLLPEEAAHAPTWRAAYSDRTADLMAKCALLAYESERAVLEAELAHGGFALVATYDEGVTQGYLAVSADLAVLAFRGSDSFADWRTNLSSRAVSLVTRLGPVRVHAGFRSAFQAVEAMVRADLATRVPPDLGLYITGHSFGAAVAQIASAALERDTLAACYTYGAPRVGDHGFDRLVKCPHYRMVNGWDFVTTLPPPVVSPFRHSGDARHLQRHGDRPLRRDRNLLVKLVQSVLGFAFCWAGAHWLFTDHRLEAYIAKLDAVLGRGTHD